jgi:hypothetical protein
LLTAGDHSQSYKLAAVNVLSSAKLPFKLAGADDQLCAYLGR